MKNKNRIPFEIIENVVEEEPEATYNVLCHYRN